MKSPILFLLLSLWLVSVCISVPVRHRASRRSTFFYEVGDGFHYHRNCVVRDTAYFKCIYYERGCLGRAVWPRGGDFRLTKHHTCPQNHLYVQEMQLRRRILARCRSLEMVPFRAIIRQERTGFPVEVQLRVTYRRLRTSMRNARLSSFPPPPATLQGLSELLQQPNMGVVTMTRDGEDSIYANSVTAADGSHCIMFASRRILRFARGQSIFFSDGTFKTTPATPECAQIFTILTSHEHHLIPIAWVLMESQTTVAYVAVLRVLRLLLGRDISLRLVITDYERAQQLAWEQVFGGNNVQLQGCLWHMARAFVKYAKHDLNLQQYMAYGPIRDIIHLCIALALVPYHLVGRAFRIIMTEARREGHAVYRRARPFLSYVLRRWVNHQNRRRWMNCCGSEHRTNNISESHNRQLADNIGCHHPNIYVFLLALIEMESDAFLHVQAIENGVRINRPRRVTSIITDERLETYLQDLEPQRLNNLQPPVPPNDRAILRYLRRASYLFQNVYDDALRDL